jgi:hypothetical protein
MVDWLDDLVLKTQRQFEFQRAENEKLLELEGRKRTLGNSFFDDLKAWLRENTDTFNRKIQDKVFAIREDCPPNIMILSSRPDLKRFVTATITYTAHAHTIEISRSTSKKVSYTLELSPDSDEVMALGGSSVLDGGLNLEMLGREIIRSMLLQ